MTGFRAAYGGAQELYGIVPDMTCLGKVIGGGLPVGVYGGSIEIMSNIAPQGSVYQAGTLSGNPLAMAAGLKTLEILNRAGTYDLLEKRSKMLEEGLKDAAIRAGAKTKFYRVGTMFCSYFTDHEVSDWESVKTCDTKRFGRYFSLLLENGINIAPSQFEAGFMSTVHSERDIEDTVKACYEALIKSS
ncbi:MAG: aminotransferase class III-fold pyridoxal phosphate-dependent enzyme [Nitrospirae bacterium]|nr:aminotransferase class III-fold pyridoxal phosphate-dependent enzyme [Nitrospirota bacterium]